MGEMYKVSSNPHVRSKVTTNGIMLAVILALMPATGFGVYHFGIRALAVVCVTMASTVLTEFLFGLYKKKTDDYRFIGGSDRASACPEPSCVHSLMDGSAGRGICHSCCKDALRGIGAEFYESCSGSTVLPADFLSGGHDEFFL